MRYCKLCWSHDIWHQNSIDLSQGPIKKDNLPVAFLEIKQVSLRIENGYQPNEHQRILKYNWCVLRWKKVKFWLPKKLIDLWSKYPIFYNTKIQNVNKPYVLPIDYTQSNQLLKTTIYQKKNITRRPGQVKFIHFTVEVV